MRVHEITDQIRNDVYGWLECEACGHTQKFVGYDDANYDNNVLPNIKCRACGETANSIKASSKPSSEFVSP